MRKKSLARLLALVMAFLLLSTTAFATVKIDQNYINGLNTEEYRGTDNCGNEYVSVPQGDDGDSDYKLVEDVKTEYTLKFTHDATLDLNGCTIDHDWNDGSVIWVGENVSLTIEDNSGKGTGTITHGTGTSTGYYRRGGGIYTERGYFSKLTIDSVNITNNTAEDGGGIFTRMDTNITNTNISDNVVSGYGAGIENEHGNLTIDHSTISNNTCNTSGKYGAAVAVAGNMVTITNNTISGNTSSSYVVGRVNGPPSDRITLNNNIISGNTATDSAILLAEGTTQCGNKFYGNKGLNGEATTDTSPSHTEGAAVLTKVPTCTEEGENIYYCTNCKNEVRTEAVDALNHDYIKATCTEPATCTVCGVTEGEALGHAWNAGVVTTAPDYGIPGLRTYTCSVCGDTRTESIPALVAVVFGEQVTGDGTSTGTGTGTGANNGTNIANDLIPLAGIVTEAQLLEALYQHEDAPEVEIVEKYAAHEYAPAISWALANGIVVEDEDNEFDPDEVVTVAILRNVLTAYVEFKEVDFTVTVDGEDDEIVMDLGERLTVFFAELEK